jgi:hypothetical protein
MTGRAVEMPSAMALPPLQLATARNVSQTCLNLRRPGFRTDLIPEFFMLRHDENQSPITAWTNAANDAFSMQ